MSIYSRGGPLEVLFYLAVIQIIFSVDQEWRKRHIFKIIIAILCLAQGCYFLGLEVRGNPFQMNMFIFHFILPSFVIFVNLAFGDYANYDLRNLFKRKKDKDNEEYKT